MRFTLLDILLFNCTLGLAVTTDQDEFGALETNENEISLDEDQSSHDDMNSLLTDSVTCTESGIEDIIF